MRRSSRAARGLLALGLVAFGGLAPSPLALRADDPTAREQVDTDRVEHADRRAKAFAEAMTGVRLTGQFTVAGKDGPPKDESYTITSVRHIGGDMYMFEAAMKDAPAIGLPLKVLYAGDTPVITLDDFTIPDLGTFDARVMIHSRMYAGTWKHGDHGGLLFGKIEKTEATQDAETK